MRLTVRIAGDTDRRHVRACGVLMPLFSLPSRGGIGTLGSWAYRLIDMLCESGQRYWQMLPIGPTGYGDSPYQCFSAFAGNPLFIDLDMLCESGLIGVDELNRDWGADGTRVDYGKVYSGRRQIFARVYERFFAETPPDFYNYCDLHRQWLDNYALFMAIKDSEGGRPFTDWPEGIRRRTPAALNEWTDRCSDGIKYHKMLQYLFSKQWVALHDYARRHGVELIGDIPIYVSPDSVELWTSPHLFATDKKGNMTAVAGCPPDGFSPHGQLWGNPLYNWHGMRKNGYAWWIARLGYSLQLFDRLRIDHFRGFEGYYCIPRGANDAVVGTWRKGPGYDFWSEVERKLGRLPIIAEDLGFITPGVTKLVERCGFESMKVMQFAFDSREESQYLPHNYARRCAVYTGTHDNSTVLGWTKEADAKDVAFARRYLGAETDDEVRLGMMRAAIASTAETCILTMPDLLALGNEGRINTPSTVSGNWQWRASEGQMDSGWQVWLNEQCRLFGRTAKGETDNERN